MIKGKTTQGFLNRTDSRRRKFDAGSLNRMTDDANPQYHPLTSLAGGSIRAPFGNIPIEGEDTLLYTHWCHV